MPLSVAPKAARSTSDVHPDPLVVEVARGALVESRHVVHAVVSDAAGAIVAAWGDTAGWVYARSAIKPLQAVPLVESGAADAFGLSDAELALACASHNGEPAHVAAVEAWLARIGLSPADLACGTHLPIHEPSAHALLRAGTAPGPQHNNCSGKHTGVLTTAVHLGEPTGGYIRPKHPAQQRIVAVLEAFTGIALCDAPRGVDGCGFPQLGLPLAALATGMARLADPGALRPERRAAVARINAAVAAEPFMIAGTGRFCTAVVEATRGRVLAKAGAEGVYTAWWPDAGLGVALKVADGAARPRNLALAAMLRHLGALDEAAWQALLPAMGTVVRNHAGDAVGELRVAAGGGLRTATA